MLDNHNYLEMKHSIEGAKREIWLNVQLQFLLNFTR